MNLLQKKILLAFFCGLILNSLRAQVQPNPALTVQSSEVPAKTIFIKHPAANDAATFFSTSTVYVLYIFNPGSKQELGKIARSFTSDPAVESCTEGQKGGDYHELTLTLKAAKDKMWFVNLFKKAGLKYIQINNNKHVEVDKM